MLDLLSTLIFPLILIPLIIFAFKNPLGYKKIYPHLVTILTFAYGYSLGYVTNMEYNFSGSLFGDIALSAAIVFTVYVGLIYLGELWKLNDNLN